MEQLELKHLAPYLPYGLRGEYQLKDVSSNYPKELRNKELDMDNVEFFLAYCKPILSPLSDLINEIKEIFIGAYSSRDNICLTIMSKKGNQFIEWSNDNGWDLVTAKGNVQIYKDYELIAPYSIMQELFKRHFDVFGLIEKGIAIDINTLNDKTT